MPNKFEKGEAIDADADLRNADWTKTTWDLPPYKSREFFNTYPVETLPAFRKLPVYQAAVDKGLIHDDEWVADFV